ncbi:transporter, major facilitator family protein [Microcella alkaliphila]|uniref:Transporter, major facilitator family protein n=1 Tax=Microcella alkaliphila TaxID=279828 RepID=A0A0U5BL37_9MICO|nr:transporter, major facilitator family protein [Microcella alkaliphila]
MVSAVAVMATPTASSPAAAIAATPAVVFFVVNAFMIEPFSSMLFPRRPGLGLSFPAHSVGHPEPHRGRFAPRSVSPVWGVLLE